MVFTYIQTSNVSISFSHPEEWGNSENDVQGLAEANTKPRAGLVLGLGLAEATTKPRAGLVEESLKKKIV